MKKIMWMFFLSWFFLYNIQSMLRSWYEKSSVSPFNTYELNQKPYDTLILDLYSLCDDYVPQGSFTWFDTVLSKGDENAFKYIEKRAEEGCIVSCYMMVRNLTEKCSEVLQSNDFKKKYVLNEKIAYVTNIHLRKCMLSLMMCLFRTGMHAIFYYARFKDFSGVKSYGILKKKFKYLLTTYLTKIKFDENLIYPKFKYIFRELVDTVNIKIQDESFYKDCLWVSHLSWKSSWTYGITFEPIATWKESVLYKQETVNVEELLLATYSIFAYVDKEKKLTLLPSFKKWQDFFDKDDEEDIKKILIKYAESQKK